MSFRDDWPKMPDGRDFDGQHLLTLVRSGNSPFRDRWDVNLLIQEIEENLCAQVIDIPCVSSGSNNYLSNGMDVVARLARGDVNMPDYDGFPIHVQVPEVKFEAEVYELLQSEPDILASRLLYYRVPVQHEGPKLDRPQDIAGRRLFVFQKAEGENNVWSALSQAQKSCLLSQAAHICASLYKFQVPPEFASAWLRERFFEQKPESFPIPVAPTREFCVTLFLDAPDYKRTIREGKDARHLWFALRDWRGDDPDDYFGDLGAWAEKRIKELGVNQEVNQCGEDRSRDS